MNSAPSMLPLPVTMEDSVVDADIPLAPETQPLLHNTTQVGGAPLAAFVPKHKLVEALSIRSLDRCPSVPGAKCERQAPFVNCHVSYIICCRIRPYLLLTSSSHHGRTPSQHASPSSPAAGPWRSAGGRHRCIPRRDGQHQQ